MENLELVLGGRPGEIDAMAVANSLEETVKLLRSVADGEIDCTIGDLEVGSACVGILAPEREVETVVNGLRHLEGSEERPSGWTNRSLEIVQRLAKNLQRRGVESLKVGNNRSTTVLGRDLLQNVDSAIRSDRRALGSVEGRIYAYSNRAGQVSATLEEAVRRRAVKLTVPPEMAAEIRRYIDADVLVWGLLTRSPEDNLVREIEVEGIGPTERHQLPGLVTKFQGAISEYWPADLDPVAAVREQRG